MNTFNNIFKSNFLENAINISLVDIVMALLLAFGVGLFIYLVYKKTFQGVMYSMSFGVTLIALTMISTLVILAVTSNVILSLGMVGALSIVRFRTAIKEPLDIAFLFWSIAAGIVLAAGMIPLALIGSAMIGLVLVMFVSKQIGYYPYMVVIQCNDSDTEVKALSILDKNIIKRIIKGKVVKEGYIELTIDIRLKEDNTEFINEIQKLDGVSSSVLVSYNGEYKG